MVAPNIECDEGPSSKLAVSSDRVVDECTHLMVEYERRITHAADCAKGAVRLRLKRRGARRVVPIIDRPARVAVEPDAVRRPGEEIRAGGAHTRRSIEEVRRDTPGLRPGLGSEFRSDQISRRRSDWSSRVGPCSATRRRMAWKESSRSERPVAASALRMPPIPKNSLSGSAVSVSPSV